MPRDARAYLYDMVQAGNLIKRFAGGHTFETYSTNDLVRSGIERQFEIIGEALNHLAKLDASALQAIREHRKIIGFRNILIHGYAEVDDSIVWSIVSEKLPLLLTDVERLLAESPPPSMTT
jgi:uncharacterized protein with HEPN domain